VTRRGQFCAIQSAGQSIGDIGSGGALGGLALSARFAITMCLAKAVLSGFPK
jgi:hypothetical protein